MPWETSSVMEKRIEFVILANQESVNFRSLCNNFGISRPTGYRWVARYHKTNSLSTLFEHSRCPHRIANKTLPENEHRIIELCRKYGWGAKKLRVLLLRENIDMKVVTINRFLKRNNLIDVLWKMNNYSFSIFFE